jgi:dTDP-glucose pyrophosphorylase
MPCPQIERKFQEIVLSRKAKIRDAAAVIQQQNLKFILVCDENNRLLGTVTDGDIRRSVLSDLNRNSPIGKIMNTSPMVANEYESAEDVGRRMKSAIIKFLPLLGQDGRVLGIYCLDNSDRLIGLENPVVIMAGGRGERLYPLTKNIPKPMLDVGGKPVLERSIETLAQQGFQKFYISINYLGHMIEDYFGNGDKLGVKIMYIRESRPLGTAGALRELAQYKSDFPFVVMNGDLLTKANLRPMVALCKGDVRGIIGAREYSYTVPFGCLTISDGHVTSIREKPTVHHFINAGVYVFSPRVLDYISVDSHLDMPGLFQKIVGAGYKLRYHHITEDWVDIGSVEDLAWARETHRVIN